MFAINSASFLPRDAMHSADYAVARCPSVCPSVCHTPCRYYVETTKDIISPSGSHTILFFPYQTLRQYSDGDPPNGTVECRGMKNRDFRPISRFISETIQVRGMECE